MAPLFIQTHQYTRMITVGFLLGTTVIAALYSLNVIMIVSALVLIGILGGIFVVPMNTLLQEQGKPMVGVGKTIAIQNFVENICMVAGVGLFKWMRSGDAVFIDHAIMIVSGFFFLLLIVLAFGIRKRSV